jgi:hypothetical protein
VRRNHPALFRRHDPDGQPVRGWPIGGDELDPGLIQPEEKMGRPSRAGRAWHGERGVVHAGEVRRLGQLGPVLALPLSISVNSPTTDHEPPFR